MKKNALLLALILLCALNAFAQDTLLRYNRWQDFFKDYTKEQYAHFKNEQFNKKFKYGESYNCLVIYKDSTRAAIEFKMPFVSIESLCDPKVNLEGKNYKGNGTHSIPKKEVRYFVFDDVPFVFDNIVRKHYSIVGPTYHYWSVVLIDGPIRYTKNFSITTFSSGVTTSGGLGTIQKYEDDIGSDIDILGAFSFRKWAAKTFADYPELAAKIAAEQEGYSKKDGLKIITEYNEWVRKSDPEAFKKTMIFGHLIQGSMGDK
jgi:hypothetical protein